MLNDTKDRKREQAERERLEGRFYDQTWRAREARAQADRIRRVFQEHPERGSRAQDRIARLERIAERSSMRHLPGFDPQAEVRAEDIEIRANPYGFLLRHAGEPLDAATEREVWLALDARDRRRR